MASYNQNNTIILILFSLICLNIHAGDNDDTLVSKMCGSTNVPNVCKCCVESYAEGAKEESDVIRATLKVWRKRFLTAPGLVDVMVDVNASIYDPKIGPKMQVELMILKPMIKNFTESAGMVQQEVKLNKFDDARAHLNDLVLGKLAQCDQKLIEPGTAIPPAVLSGFLIVEAYYKLSDQLLAYVQQGRHSLGVGATA